nr:DUF2141 domain-containing protein [Sphingomicrobium aestuariivivum]
MTAAANPSPRAAELTVELENVRNAKGEIRICMTRDVEQFLKCREDPQAVKVRVAATEGESEIRVPGLSEGRWMLLVLHDENGNGKMSKSLGIPKEGFGFSGNPAIRMGPPRAEDVVFDLPAGQSSQRVRVKYIL